MRKCRVVGEGNQGRIIVTDPINVSIECRELPKGTASTLASAKSFGSDGYAGGAAERTPVTVKVYSKASDVETEFRVTKTIMDRNLHASKYFRDYTDFDTAGPCGDGRISMVKLEKGCDTDYDMETFQEFGFLKQTFQDPVPLSELKLQVTDNVALTTCKLLNMLSTTSILTWRNDMYHADLKPDNILYVKDDPYPFRLVDIGSFRTLSNDYEDMLINPNIAIRPDAKVNVFEDAETNEKFKQLFNIPALDRCTLLNNHLRFVYSVVVLIKDLIKGNTLDNSLLSDLP